MAKKRGKQSRPPGVRSVAPRGKPARRSRRKRKLRVGIFLTALVAAGIFTLLSLTVLFRITAIEAADTSHYTADQIAEASGLQTGKNLFLADRDAAARQIERLLPYAESVQVSIGLPDKIRISVREAEPAIVILQDEKYYLLSSGYKLLETAEQLPEIGSPVVTGAGMTEPEPGKTATFGRDGLQDVLQTLLDRLDDSGLSGVTQIDMTEMYALKLQFGDKLTVLLGSTSGLEDKLRLAKYVIENRIDLNQAGTLDLTQGSDQAIYRPNYGSGGVIIPPSSTADPVSTSSR